MKTKIIAVIDSIKIQIRKKLCIGIPPFVINSSGPCGHCRYFKKEQCQLDNFLKIKETKCPF